MPTAIPLERHSTVVSVLREAARVNGDVEAYVKPIVARKTDVEIARFNHQTLTRKPTGESLRHFEDLRAQIAPGRTDVTSWPDLLDLDEGRPVPQAPAGS